MSEKTLAIITDSRGGMMFNSRRQARDAEVISDMVARFGKGGICIAPYSLRLLEQCEGLVVVSDPVVECDSASLVFIEDPSLIGFEKIERVVIYRYGIPYPADRFFDRDLGALGYKMISKDKFATALHKKVEREVYKKVLNI